jgi:anti-sigma factor RsiW
MQTPKQSQPREFGALNHPNPEEWMEYLYGEMPRATARLLRAHLEGCAACRKQHQDWQRTQSRLGGWTVAPNTAVPPPIPFSFKLALAALLVLGMGVGIGRLTMPRPNLEALRAAIEPALRASLVRDLKSQMQEELRADWQAALDADAPALNTLFRQQLHSSLEQWRGKAAAASRAETQGLLLRFAQTAQANREEDLQAVLTVLERADQRYQAEQISLRRALETVAVVADDQFQKTESQLGQLASYTEAQFHLESFDQSIPTQMKRENP